MRYKLKANEVTKSVQIKMPESFDETIARAAQIKGMSKSAMVRKALEAYLEEYMVEA